MNRNSKGFTLIELMIVVTILGIIAAVIVPIVGEGFNSGISEMFQRGGTICKAGVLFSVDVHGFQTQVIGPNGGGIACQ
jgi:prepilin-type N-terminal cleavage/methylation domain-containing protein